MQKNYPEYVEDPKKNDSESFDPESNDNQHGIEEDGANSFDYYDDFEDDSYGRSYEKYNGYNGWSDDVIDDAFEGDPEATWNVD